MARFLAILVCALVLFRPAPAAAQTTTALFFDSQPGDWIGQGLSQTWVEGELKFTATLPSPRVVRIFADNFSSGSPSTWWGLTFKVPEGSPVAPGVYESAERFAGPLRPELDVSGSGRGCNQLTGRFVVYEVTIVSGAVTSFAADFEQHCEDGIPALFGAIRFNSSRSSLIPFDGAYPFVALHIDPSPFGLVSGAGIDCGNGGVDCDEQYGSPTTVALTVTPAPGYAFLGWTGNCEGKLAPASLLVAQRRRCAAVFDALPDSGLPPPLIGGTAFFVDTQAAPWWPAERWVLLPSDTKFTPSGSPTTARIAFGLEAGDLWQLAFEAPQGQVLAPGTYDNVRGSPFKSPMVPGFSLIARGTTCTSLHGRFVVYEVSFDGAGTLQRFAADFEEHCEGQVPGTAGAIRFNSTRGTLIPFDGAYPLYRLTIVPPVNGSVTGAGIDCGVDCVETYSSGGTVALTAHPAPGYLFVGWTGDCGGSSNGTLLVISTHVCGAVFDNEPGHAGPLPEDLGLGSLSFFSQRGDYIGQGQRHVWTRAESLFAVEYRSWEPPQAHAAFVVTAPDGDAWWLNFEAPAGQVLRPGDFTGATRYPFQASSVPGMDISGHGRGCNQLTGRFRIYEIHFDATGKVDQFAADFEQHCEGGMPALFGAIRYNSTRSSLLPFDGAFLPLPAMALNPPANGSSVFGAFLIAGWALNTGDTYGTGVDAVHVYAYPLSGGAPIFLGVAAYGIARPDVGAIFGTRYTNSGFSLTAGPLPTGPYLLAALAHDTVTGNFDIVATATITVVPPPAAMAVGVPSDGAHVSGPFLIAGWAIDGAAPSGSGVDAIHAWAWPSSGPPIFLGATTTDAPRPDVAAIFGGRFLVSGFNLVAPSLPQGTYVIAVYAHSAATGTFNQVRTLTIVVD